MSRGNIILITKHKMMFGWPLRGLPKMNMFNKSLDFVKHMFRRFPVSVPPPLPFVFLSIERGGGYVRRLGGGGKKSGVPILSRPTPSVPPPRTRLPFNSTKKLSPRGKHAVVVFYGTESPFCLRNRIHKSSKMRTRDE